MIEELELPTLNLMGDGVLQTYGTHCTVHLFVSIEEGRLTLTLRGNPFIQPLHFMTMDEFIEKYNDGNQVNMTTKRYVDNTTECRLVMDQDPTVVWNVSSVKKEFFKILSTLNDQQIYYFRKNHIVAYNSDVEIEYTAFNPTLHKHSLKTSYVTQTFDKVGNCGKYIKALKLFCRYNVESACIVFGYQSLKNRYGVQLSVDKWLRSDSCIDTTHESLDYCVLASPPFRGSALKTYYVTFKRNDPSTENTPNLDSKGFQLQSQGMSYFV